MVAVDTEKQRIHLNELVRLLGTAVQQLQQAQALALCTLSEVIVAEEEGREAQP